MNGTKSLNSKIRASYRCRCSGELPKQDGELSEEGENKFLDTSLCIVAFIPLLSNRVGVPQRRFK